MAGAKRKNEAPQQTRIDYDAGAGGGYDAPDASAGIFSRADPHTLSRRKVAVAVTPTAGSSGGAGISGPTLYRRERYHREMGQLNFEFAEWAKREEAKYVAAIKARGAGETQRGPTRFFLSAIDFYTVRARTITENMTILTIILTEIHPPGYPGGIIVRWQRKAGSRSPITQQ